jgi:hypothetical protein
LTLTVLLIGAALPATAATPDPYLPSDTEIVIAVNVRQILDAPLVKKDLEQLREHLSKSGEVQKTLEALGFDPFKDLESITVAGVGANNPDRMLIVVHGRFDLAKFQAKAGEVGKDKDSHLKIIKEGSHTLYETEIPGQGRAMLVGLADQDTIVASTNKESVVEALDVKAGKKKNQLKKEFQDLIEKSDPKQSLRVVALGSAINSLPQAESVKNILGGLSVGDDLRADFTITTEDAKSAKDLAKTLEDLLDQGKNFVSMMAQGNAHLAGLTGLVDSLKVSDKGSTVVIKGEVSKEKIEQLKKKS